MMTNFENPNKAFNYSTVDKVGGTIQDKIDNNIITMNSLTSEKLKHLQADIDDNIGSFLRIRDDNGKVIGKLNENKDVEFIGKKEVSTYKGIKVFLKIKTAETTGWVSADYMTADIGETTAISKSIKNTPIKKSEKDSSEIISTKKPEKEKLKKPDFNYKEPQRDADGYLLARTDLQSAEEILDGYSSTEELFTKLNSINETQIEPLFKPYYYGEVDPETSEKIPTYIIVGDMHADEYNIDGIEEDEKIIMILSKLALGKKLLIENNKESSSAEINSISSISQKFQIKNIGLENEFFGKEGIQNQLGKKYGIGEGLERKGIKYMGLEKEKLNMNVQEKELMSLMLELKIYEKLGINLTGINFTKEEFISYYHGNKSDISELVDDSSGRVPFDKILKKQKENYNRLKNIDKKELENEYKFLKYTLMKMLGEENVNILLNNTIHSYNETISIHQLLSEKSRIEAYNYTNTIVNRNKIGINIISQHLGEDKVGVMVYGKAHIANLIKQLKQKYNGKVNIYVAK